LSALSIIAALIRRPNVGGDRQRTEAKSFDQNRYYQPRSRSKRRPQAETEQAVDALFHSMKAALTRGDRIELRGFGVFVVKPRKRGVGRNPRTGQEVPIPSGKTIRFKPGRRCKFAKTGKSPVTRQIPV